MPTTLVDLVKVNILSTGTGPFVLGSEVTGYFGTDALTDGATYGYSVQQGADKEYGHGVYDAAGATFTRNILKSSLGTDPVPFMSGAQLAFVLLAEDLGGGEGGAFINDQLISENFVWSSYQTNAQIEAASTIQSDALSALASFTATGLASKEPSITSGTVLQYWRGDKTWQSLNKAAVGLSNVDNTSDAAKPISTAMQSALDTKISAVTDFVGRPILPMKLNRPVPPGYRLNVAVDRFSTGQLTRIAGAGTGDSLEGTSFPTGGSFLREVLADWAPTVPVYSGDVGSIPQIATNTTQTYTGTIYPIGGKFTGQLHQKEIYTRAIDGTIMELRAPGEYSVCGFGGRTQSGDTLIIPIQYGPGEGTVLVQYSTADIPVVGSGWLDPTAGQILSGQTLTGGQLIIDCNQPTKGTFIIKLGFGSSITPLSTKLTQLSGGSVWTTSHHVDIVSATSLPFFRPFWSASNDWALSDPACAPYCAPVYDALNLTYLFFNTDDKPASYDKFFIVWDAIKALMTTSPFPQVVWEDGPCLSNGPANTDQTLGQRTSNVYDRIQNKVGEDVLDILAMTGGLAQTVALGINGDSNPWIHYEQKAARPAIWWWAAIRGLVAHSGRRAGGDADATAILANSSNRLLTALHGNEISLRPTRFETGYMTWLSTPTLTGAMTPMSGSNAGMHFVTGTTAGAAVAASINGADVPMALNQTNINALQGMSQSFRLNYVATPDCAFYIIASARAYNAQASGDLLSTDIGFAVKVLNGVATAQWLGPPGPTGTVGLRYSTDVAFAVNGGSKTIIQGGAGHWVRVMVDLIPSAISIYPEIRVSIGKTLICVGYWSGGNLKSFRNEMLQLNGSTTNRTADASYPIIDAGNE